jgi:hypothetical protein
MSSSAKLPNGSWFSRMDSDLELEPLQRGAIAVLVVVDYGTSRGGEAEGCRGAMAGRFCCYYLLFLHPSRAAGGSRNPRHRRVFVPWLLLMLQIDQIAALAHPIGQKRHSIIIVRQSSGRGYTVHGTRISTGKPRPWILWAALSTSQPKKLVVRQSPCLAPRAITA